MILVNPVLRADFLCSDTSLMASSFNEHQRWGQKYLVNEKVRGWKMKTKQQKAIKETSLGSSVALCLCAG